MAAWTGSHAASFGCGPPSLTANGRSFVEALERCGGCPKLVPADMVEVVKDIQPYLGRNDEDGRAAERSYITEEELNGIRSVWNAHRIRPSKTSSLPGGMPDVMYLAAHLWGAEDCLIPLTEDLSTCKDSCTFLSSGPCDEDVFDLFSTMLNESSLEFPSTMSQALDFHFHLRDMVASELFEAM